MTSLLVEVGQRDLRLVEPESARPRVSETGSSATDDVTRDRKWSDNGSNHLLCDKLQWTSVGARRYYHQFTDDGPLSVHLSRAKLITRFDDRYDVRNFQSPEF